MQKDREKIRMYNAIYVLAIVLIGVICIIISRCNSSDAELEFKNQPVIVSEDEAGVITVYVTGEVNSPGLYEIEPGTRIQQIIEIAGGATPGADLEGVNLAKTPKDGEQIKVPAMKKSGASGYKGSSANVKTPEVKVDINCGNAAEYMKINGVTDEIALNIAEHIEEFGGFKSIEELQFVKGMTPSVYDKIEKYYKD